MLIISVYMSTDSFSDDLETLSRYINACLSNYEGPLIVGGDFNARIGNENQMDEMSLPDGKFNAKRRSHDLIFNRQGRQLVTVSENLGSLVLYGRSPSDHEGQFTFSGNNGSNQST
ncbi:hypothetical protein QAD02_013966 [Eretmocerus hayati]|uniref:Uncharacterized protein n=1 Tax=Eretmocerus hayati TaxID=131215 RepID=A0ACC2P4D6_9HYME|nr:hypothetical protein QAD02_013966 [Eretmocerus hayati]